MGYYLSKLPYSQHQLSSNSLHERPLQHIQFSRDTHRPISDGGYSDLVANVDLYSRLAVLEKDLRDAQAENANQEAVIHYLLNAKVHRVGLGSKDLDLVILNLEEKINLVTEDSKQLKVKFQGLLNNTAVPVLDATSRPGDSTSTGSSSCCKRSESEKSQSEDLIDLLDSSKGPETDLIDEDDASLSDNDGDDASYEEDGFPKATPDMSSSEPLQSAFPESNYIHHFVDGDSGSHDLKKGDEIVTKEYEHGPGFARNATRLLTNFEKHEFPTSHKGSSPGYLSSSSSAPVSTASSFTDAPSGEANLPAAPYDLSGYSDSQLTAYAAQLWNEVRATHAGGKLEALVPKPRMVGKSMTSLPASAKHYDTSSTLKGDSTRLCWSISEIFNSRQEREAAISINRRNANLGARDLPFPNLFNYGIRYMPRRNERDIYRTIIISNLPSNTTLMMLLSKVRGGMVIDAKLLNTSSITGGQTALVTFLHEYSAKAYKDHAKKHPVMFGNVASPINIASTPTWPMPFNLRNMIYQNGRTRCFEVQNLPSSISPSVLKADLNHSSILTSNGLESMRMNGNRILGLRFASVVSAGSAAAMFQNAFRYSGCKVNFLPDPCAQPVGTLLQESISDPRLVDNISREPKADCAVTPIHTDQTLVDESCRLSKVEWQDETQFCRGRGFKSNES